VTPRNMLIQTALSTTSPKHSESKELFAVIAMYLCRLQGLCLLGVLGVRGVLCTRPSCAALQRVRRINKTRIADVRHVLGSTGDGERKG